MQSVVITGMGAVCPIGVGLEEVWASVESRKSGVRKVDELVEAGWITPFGGVVSDFEPKQFVKPRKSLKVMADEIQYAFAAGEQAWASAGFAESPDECGIDPERMGVVTGAGLMYSDTLEMEQPYGASLNEGGSFTIQEWGARGMREMYPLWMLKYLPNMSACHIGIRRDARGPTNTIAHQDASSLLALSEAAEVIRRDQADVMITGGSSRRLYMTDPLWYAGSAFWQTGGDPATASRPFDAGRVSPVCGEGAAMLVLESRQHAQRRGAKPIAEVLSVVSRTETHLGQLKFTGAAIASAIAAAIEHAGVKPEEIGSVNAHGLGTLTDDVAEAQAIHQTLGSEIPVTAPKSFFGNLGAASGTLELIVSLLGGQQGVIPPTINHDQTDPECPITVAREATKTDKSLMLAVNYNTTGQAVAAVLRAE